MRSFVTLTTIALFAAAGSAAAQGTPDAPSTSSSSGFTLGPPLSFSFSSIAQTTSSANATGVATTINGTLTTVFPNSTSTTNSFSTTSTTSSSSSSTSRSIITALPTSTSAPLPTSTGRPDGAASLHHAWGAVIGAAVIVAGAVLL